MLAKYSKEKFTLDAALIQEEVKKLGLPLTFESARNIYKWLVRDQIRIDMLPAEILDEFKKLDLYDRFMKRL